LRAPELIATLANQPHFAAFRFTDYRRLWTANMFSGSAMWTFIVASSWLVLNESDKSALVGVITFASMLPFLLVSPVGGLLADRYDRRRLAQVTFWGSLLVNVTIAVLAVAGGLQVWHIAVMAFIGGTFRATQEPAVQALIPNQVPSDVLLNAITLNAVTRHGARFFGLLVAAPLLAIPSIGVAGVLVLSAIFSGIGVIQIMRTRTVSRGEIRPESGLTRGMLDGLIYVYTNKTIGLFMVMVMLHCVLVMSFESILPILSRQTLGAEDGSVLGYLVMALGVGALVGILLLAGVTAPKNKGRLLLIAGLVSGIAPIFLAVSGNVPLAIVASIVMGASQATFMALTSAYIQLIAPDQLRGRISSLYLLHTGGMMAFANLGYGFTADAFSAPPIFIITGLAFIIAIALIGGLQPILRRVYITGQV
jgi:MFS family permease